MATPRTLLHRPLQRLTTPITTPPRRTFLPNPFHSPLNPLANPQTSPAQTLTATQTLPYASPAIYSIIADVQSYASFLPYCHSSTVTQWSQPDATHQRRWPSSAALTIGFGRFTEHFTSRVFCVPGRIVESIGGASETDLARDAIAHHLDATRDADRVGAGGASSGLMTHLKSRWEIESVGPQSTRVRLSLEFAFANPIYAALSAGAAPRVADVMVRAFEERVGALLEADPDMARAELGQLEGSRVRR